MLIAYFTTDEVNEELANRRAEAAGVKLYPMSARDELPNGRFDAVVYDLDFVPWKRRKELLARLLAKPSRNPVALHSYNLDDQEMEDLRSKNVAVFHRLQPEVFKLVRLMAGL